MELRLISFTYLFNHQVARCEPPDCTDHVTRTNLWIATRLNHGQYAPLFFIGRKLKRFSRLIITI